MIGAVTAGAVFAEFVVGSLVLVPMSAGRRRRPVERPVASGPSRWSPEAVEALHGPRRGALGAVPDRPSPERAAETLGTSPSQNGPSSALQGRSGAPRCLPGPWTPDAGGAP